jgi:hypothetical protein
MIYEKRKKNGDKGHWIFYLSKEHYQQQFYVDLLFIVHQQQFNLGTAIDSELSRVVPRRTAADTWAYKLRTRLLARNHLAKFCFPHTLPLSGHLHRHLLHRPPPFQDSFDATVSVLGSRPTQLLRGDAGTTVHQAAISFAVWEPPPHGPPSAPGFATTSSEPVPRTSTSSPCHRRSPSTATATIDLLLSCATPLWGSLLGELLFPPSLHPHY